MSTLLGSGQDRRAVPPAQDETFWESVARTTEWGKYLTGREQAALELAISSRLRTPGEAVEVGCDGGRWSRELARYGWSLTCIDVDRATLEICRRRLPDATQILVEQGVEGLPMASESVDLLLAYEVAPVTGSTWFWHEARRLLRPGGVVVFTHWNRLSWRGFAYRTMHRFQKPPEQGVPRFEPEFYAGPSYSTVRCLLRDNGFQVEHEEGLCWLPFGRKSNSRLIPFCTRLEETLGLRHLVRVSPFIVGVARLM